MSSKKATQDFTHWSVANGLFSVRWVKTFSTKSSNRNLSTESHTLEPKQNAYHWSDHALFILKTNSSTVWAWWASICTKHTDLEQIRLLMGTWPNWLDLWRFHNLNISLRMKCQLVLRMFWSEEQDRRFCFKRINFSNWSQLSVKWW